MKLTLLGVGAMNSPRYQPAGLLLTWRGHHIMLDGGPGAAPDQPVDAWLVTDDHAELIRDIRVLARTHHTEPMISSYTATHGAQTLTVAPYPVAHTSHPTYGYRLACASHVAVWAPEFWQFPGWADGTDLMFADAAGWNRPIRFARGTGGHASVHDTAAAARAHGVRRLVFAHIGRPSIRAIDAGALPPFGEWGTEGHTYQPRRRSHPGPEHG